MNTGGWDVDGKELDNPPQYTSGLWLFVDRDNISHFFPPNFYPPYNTPEKHYIIMEFLKDEWDEKSLSWKPMNGNDGTTESHGETSAGDESIFSALPNLCSLWP